MFKQFIASVLIFIISVSASLGQSYYFRHYQVENGLSNNTVFCCVQDKSGFMWMGTKDGLNRFDGYNYKIFRNDGGDTLSIGDNFIRSLYIDANDILYVGTRNGLYRYNKSGENFTIVYKTPGEIRDIKKDEDGNLWFVAAQTLIRYTERNKNTLVFKPENYFSATSVCINNKNIWVATTNGLLKKFNEKDNSFTGYNLFKPSQVSTKWIEKIYATDSNTILVGTSNYGVKVFNLTNYSFKDILTYNEDKTAIFARDFLQTNPNEYWIATEAGIYIFNAITNTFTNLKKYNNPYALSDNAIYSLCKDKEGGIWAGTYFGGTNYYPKQYNAFEKYFPQFNKNSLSGYAVREICEDKYGKLWIGTEDAGLNKFDKNTGLFTQFKPGGKSSEIAYTNIHGLLAKNDELWIGTFEHGLDIMNIKTGKVIKHYPGKDNSKILKSTFIVTILQTSKGKIFIGTRLGLYTFNEDKKHFEPITAIPSYCFIHSLLEDNDGTVWIGTIGNGLYNYNNETKRTSNYLNSPGNSKSIGNNSITTIFKDSYNNIWFGTEGGGLCKLNKTDNSFTTLTTKDGLPSNSIFKILEDGHKNLWITTSKGLVCYNDFTKNINVYTTADGLLSDQFNYNSGYKSKDGIMYFGSAKGLLSFNPEGFTINNFKAPVYITSVLCNNKEMLQNTVDSNIGQLNFLYNQSTFSIDFAALSFTAPEKISYKYMLEGFDKGWTYLQTNRKIYFTNLSPGKYLFKVNAANSSGKWNKEDTVLSIQIHPPIWLSKGAYFIYILIIALTIYYFFKGYHQRMADKNDLRIELLEHDKDKEIYEAKIDFFTNVAHEIRTPLTLIKAPLEKIIKKTESNSAISQYLKIMERNTERLIELTNQLLDFRKIENNNFNLEFTKTNINQVLIDQYENFKTIAELKKIALSIDVCPTPIFAYVDNDAFNKILNNLFYNAIIYSGGKVIIKLYLEDNKEEFIISFSNDGYLIPPGMKEKIFEPFFRLKETQYKTGTGIGLSLSKSLVTLHNGNIFLKETDNGMNTFILIVPLQQIKNNGG